MISDKETPVKLTICWIEQDKNEGTKLFLKLPLSLSSTTAPPCLKITKLRGSCGSEYHMVSVVRPAIVDSPTV